MKDSESGDKSSTTDSNASQTDNANGNSSDQKENGIKIEDPRGIVENKKNLWDCFKSANSIMRNISKFVLLICRNVIIIYDIYKIQTYVQNFSAASDIS